MSKKGKLILATAVFGAALFGASCGGGGGTASTPPPPPPPPPPGVDGQVLALLTTGTASAGTLKPVTICQLKSNDKAECGTDLNPSADVDLYYGYEFSNGDVLLVDAGGIGYFFNGSQVIKLDKFRPLGASSDSPEINAPGGITIPDPYASGTSVYVTPNFVILLTNSDKELLVITSSGKVIKDSHSSAINVNFSCDVRVTKGTTTYLLGTDGTSTSYVPSIPTNRASAGDKVLVQSGGILYLSDSGCSAGGVLVDDLTGLTVDDAKMVAVVEGTSTAYYIAVRHSTDEVNYYKVSGGSRFVLVRDLALDTDSPDYYTLDGRGRLYAITATDTVEVYKTDGNLIGSVTVTGANYLWPYPDRILVFGSSDIFEVSTNDSVVNTILVAPLTSTLGTAFSRCIDSTNTRAVVGMGTNFVRCLYDDDSGTDEFLYSLKHDSGNYTSASYNLPGASSSVAQALFGVDKVLVKPGGSSTILLCNTTPTPNISCSTTDLPNLSTNIKDYLKVNGLDVFYTNSSGTLKVGNVFDPPSALPITVSYPSGGNASFDLNKFAFSFTPVGAPCATQIVYFSSRTASPKTYTITQPSNACVARILKVFP
jgi:hypothetical protein